MHMKVQGHLIQAHFIEIHQVFTNKKGGYFSNRVVQCVISCRITDKGCLMLQCYKHCCFLEQTLSHMVSACDTGMNLFPVVVGKRPPTNPSPAFTGKENVPMRTNTSTSNANLVFNTFSTTS